MIALETNTVWNGLPFPALVLDGKRHVLEANTAAEQFLSASEKQIKKRGLPYFFGRNSIVMGTIAQAVADTSSVSQYGVDVSTAGQAAMSCNIYVNFLSPEDGTILLIVQPAGVAFKMSQSLTHLAAARSVTAMAGMLAHEIRNPLAGITGAAQLLAMNASDGDRELAEMIGQEAKRIGNLVDRVEHFGDQRPVERQPVNIHDVLDRASRSAKAGFASHVNFSLEYDPSLPEVAGDPDQLLQVFQNLIKNASEALPDARGQIRLRTSYNSGMKFAASGHRIENLPIQVEVIDNGKGIPESLIEDVFDPFVSSKSNGTGLGLSLVSKIVASHGGLIECSSGDGKTRFCVRLPIWRTKKETV
jgi:two-component system nitrogen regulation sensor histidine kinase GlnL